MSVLLMMHLIRLRFYSLDDSHTSLVRVSFPHLFFPSWIMYETVISPTLYYVDKQIYQSNVIMPPQHQPLICACVHPFTQVHAGRHNRISEETSVAFPMWDLHLKFSFLTKHSFHIRSRSNNNWNDFMSHRMLCKWIHVPICH